MVIASTRDCSSKAGSSRCDRCRPRRDEAAGGLTMDSRIHPAAHVHLEAELGEGTQVWQGAVVLAGARIGCDCNLNAHTLVEGGAIRGDRVTLKCGVYVWDGVVLEDDVFCGPNATFTNDWER
jgi:UDP-3-O-[3-hydroxymyristoyl] glucosamine N-acyltransferase